MAENNSSRSSFDAPGKDSTVTANSLATLQERYVGRTRSELRNGADPQFAEPVTTGSKGNEHEGTGSQLASDSCGS